MAVTWLDLLPRIGAPAAEPGLASLRQLQRAALQALPFENLDIHLGRPIVLDPDALHAKVIGAGRGGFCYELNEAFYQCLRALGFQAQRCAARVTLGGGDGVRFDHQWTRVHLEGRAWMVDVGMGDSCLVPLDLGERGPQTDGRSHYQIRDGAGDTAEVWRQQGDGRQGAGWSRMLVLDPEPCPWPAFAERCTWFQRAPESVFTGKRLVTMTTPDGRVSLTGNTLKRSGAHAEERHIPEADYAQVLAEHFGIRLRSPAWKRPTAS